jgi:trimeric autotransporter adhesin
MKTTTLQLTNLVNRSHVRLAFLLIPLACFVLSPQARAVCQEGCLTNNNTVLGDDALLNNTGTDNTALGFDALYFNTIGFHNAASGAYALFSNTRGSDNTASGYSALYSNITGFDNTAIGEGALVNNRRGSNNVAVGFEAGIDVFSGDNNIDIGNVGGTESNKIRIGTNGIQKATFIAGISGVMVAAGVGVIINTDGKLGTVVSSERFKNSIQPMEKASEAIFSLQPVTFRYKHELDPAGILQFGLVAEQVEKVNPNLVARDAEGKPYSVRYEAVNAMLLNEFLKEHRKVEELEGTVAELSTALKEQASQIRKMSTQMQGGKAAPQVVLNSQ